MALGGLVVPRLHIKGRPLVFDSRLIVFAAALGCIPLSLLVYWPSVDDFFVSDDFGVLHAVRGRSALEVLYRAFSFPDFKPFDEATLSWRPSTDLYFYAMSPLGIHAQPYHLVNIIMHGFIAGLAVVLLWRLSGSVINGVATGALFTVAPTYDVGVTWVVEFGELIATASILAALIAYHVYLTANRGNRGACAAALSLAVLAALSKETVVVLLVLLPSVALLTLVSGTCRRTGREIALSLTAPFVVLLAYLTLLAIHQFMANDPTHQLGPNMAGRMWDYLRWIVLPYRHGSFILARSLLAGAFIAAGVLAIVLRRTLLAVLFAWVVVALLPFSGVSVMEPRYTYLATLPFIAFAICLAIEAWRNLLVHLNALSVVLLVALIACGLTASALRTRDNQAALATEAVHWESMLDATRTLCAELPAESHIFVVGAPYFDPYRLNTQAAVNLYYDRVNAAAVPELPPLAAFIEDKCVLQYDSQTRDYVRAE